MMTSKNEETRVSPVENAVRELKGDWTNAEADVSYTPKPGEWFEFRANNNRPWEPFLLVGTDKYGNLVCEPMASHTIVRIPASTNTKHQMRAYVPSPKDLWVTAAVAEIGGVVEVDPEDLVELLEYVYIMLESGKLPKVTA